MLKYVQAVIGLCTLIKNVCFIATNPHIPIKTEQAIPVAPQFGVRITAAKTNKNKDKILAISMARSMPCAYKA